jgi:hypothetical protein
MKLGMGSSQEKEEYVHYRVNRRILRDLTISVHGKRGKHGGANCKRLFSPSEKRRANRRATESAEIFCGYAEKQLSFSQKRILSLSRRLRGEGFFREVTEKSVFFKALSVWLRKFRVFRVRIWPAVRADGKSWRAKIRDSLTAILTPSCHKFMLSFKE